jgi:hypothetical protein
VVDEKGVADHCPGGEVDTGLLVGILVHHPGKEWNLHPE